ncbi:AAA family ATPase [Pseudomonas guariconensis]|uniref:AAA family ATPase n=1 Tax=Pseudomonas guariconensis TaxID=1288410 RepID=UPI0018A8F0EC|nr:ATP-binding protein [Pseudomonas guariconensis]MBF8740663.1 AAA family ATPase [Pseudomonas guariconensis]MBF8749843.1 AAA family ATPase [Pseudomonas guariconensis]
MRIRLDKVVIKHFKRIESLEIDLKSVTALVGGNTSGKSSALQAAQLGVSILQAAYRGIRGNGLPDFAGTVANDAVLFRPTERLLDLRRGDTATQNLGYSITYGGVDLDTNADKEITVEIRRGKNANIAITRTGDDDFAAVLANVDRPFSIFTPGLSGIPIREEWRTKGAMDSAVMHGDANLYLRTVLDHLFTRDLDEMARTAWRRDHDISLLPDSGWKTFSHLLERCYPGTRIIVSHDHLRDRYVKVEVRTLDARVTLDMASTGMLQVIQIIAYACFYAPPLILLDEPDAHLHADSQARLYEALRSVASETQTRILFASHSPQLIQRLMYDPEAAVAWMNEGARVPVDDAQRPAIPILMALGALSAGADAFDPARPVILMTEDKLSRPVTVLAKANGAPDNLAVISYNGCGNLPAARLLANMIADVRPDAKIILHRDRDFRTEQEMQFEILSAASERERNGVIRVTEIFTPLNDVEHSFAQASHLKEVFDELSPELIDAAIADVIAFKRDDLVNAARVARDQLRSSLYEAPRKRRKPEWAASLMPEHPPQLNGFVPANGLIPVSFDHSHGKMLMDGLRPKIHLHAGGATQALDSRIYAATPHLIAPNWRGIFDLE